MGGRARSVALVIGCAGLVAPPALTARLAASPPSFASGRTYATARGPVSVALADLTTDGKPDLAVANADDDAVSVFTNAGHGTFRKKLDYPAGFEPESIAAGDLDRDGKRDLAVADARSNSISILLNRGDGSFPSRMEYAAGNTPLGVAIADLNEDASPDVAVADFDDSTVSVRLNGGDGNFGPRAVYRVGNAPTALAAGDVDGDGRPDLATSNLRADTISVLIGRGDGAFRPKRDYRTGSAPISVAIGDLNGDSRLDVATADRGPSSDSPGWVSVLINVGDGSFAGKRDYPIGGGPESVAIADLNGDRTPDIATADPHANNRGVDAVSVIANRGDGTFRPKIDYRVGRSPLFVAARDLDGDQRADLIAANSVGNNLSVLVNWPGHCTVQRVDGMTLRSAKPRIRRANCRVGRITNVYSDRLATGRVVTQKPAWGSVLPGGGRVDLAVSLGSKK